MRDLVTLWELLLTAVENRISLNNPEGLCIMCQIFKYYHAITPYEFDMLHSNLCSRLDALENPVSGYYWPLTLEGMQERKEFCKRAIEDLKIVNNYS